MLCGEMELGNLKKKFEEIFLRAKRFYPISPKVQHHYYCMPHILFWLILLLDF